MGQQGRYDATMRRADVIAAISGHRDEIAHRFGVRSLSLFGSVARDEARPDSDIDLVVDFEGPNLRRPHGLTRVLGGPPLRPSRRPRYGKGTATASAPANRPGPRACRGTRPSTSPTSCPPVRRFSARGAVTACRYASSGIPCECSCGRRASLRLSQSPSAGLAKARQI